MDKKTLNTTIDFELADGTTVKMTLAFYALYQLRNARKGIYERYNKIMVKGPQEELDNVVILYTAYLCANIANLDECMTEEEFMLSMSPDRKQVGEVLSTLISAKKK